MRTLMILAGGFLFWALCLGLAKLVAGRNASALPVATLVFVALWFCVAAANLWVGVAHAGYSLLEELPIFLLIFLVPAAVALVVRRRFL
jgi:hypothetical protein